VLLSSFLIALAIPNEFLSFGSPLIGLFAIFPLYLALSNSKSYINSFWLCFLHGLVTHILSSFWLGNFPGFAIFTLGASALGTAGFEGLFGLVFYFPVLYSKKDSELAFFSSKNQFALPFKLLWFTSVYTLWEYCKSTGFLAYPWGTLSMTAYKWPLITQIADITGVYGITFLFALSSAIFGEGVILLGKACFLDSLRSYRQVFALFATLIACTLFYGIHEYTRPIYPEKLMNTVLVQQNRNPNRREEEENILLAQEITQGALDKISEADEKCDLVVWSEAVLSKRFPTSQNYYNFFPSDEPLLKFIKKNHTPFIIGGPVIFNDENHEYGNSALLFDKNGKYQGFYTKMHLVPFAELIPLRQFEGVRKIIKRMIGFSYGWTPGKKPVLFEIPLESKLKADTPFDIVSIISEKNKKKDDESKSVVFSTPICFDDSAHEVCHALFHSGSELFVNITNDSWSKTDSSEIQHFVVAHYRSIEYRSTTIRAANAGYTCVIDPKGRVLADLPLFEEGSLTFKVPIYKRKMTVYARFGDWLPWTLILLSFAYIFFAIKRKKLEEQELSQTKLALLPHKIEWYELLDSVMEKYDEVYAVDWAVWDF